MKVLIACEESQEVCKAFRRLGHEAYSCDILPCSGGHPEWHIKMDVLKLLNGGRFATVDHKIHDIEGWDLMIAHPPCIRLCNSGVRWLHERNLWKEMRDAAFFFDNLMKAYIPKKCIENPIPHKYALEIINRKYNQIIQPYMFGHGESKATCLWLDNLPKLKATNIVEGREKRIHKMSPSKDRSKLRSKTFPGIARAMAEQWGGKDDY